MIKRKGFFKYFHLALVLEADCSLSTLDDVKITTWVDIICEYLFIAANILCDIK